MKRDALALIMVLVFSALAGTSFVGLTTANPFDLPVDTGIRIISTNYSSYQVKPYENSTVTLNIQVILVYGHYDQLWAENVNLESISYSLDGQPLVDVNNIEMKNHTNYGRDKQHFLEYTATVRLEDLSEGPHTVTAYANGMSSSHDFTVNSHYVVTEINVLSPTNQTYSNTVPLVFTVNGEIEEAHYYMYRGYDAVFEGSFSGNTTLENPPGVYVMHLYVTTEKGQAVASTYFSISPSSISRSNYLPDSPPVAAYILAVIMVGIGLGLLVYLIKRK
jgi:hypothetical protein